MAQFIQVQTTTARREEAEAIAAELVEKRLAACVQIIGPIASTYRWEGEVETAEEWLLLIKTTASAYDTVEDAIALLHSYEVPEIIALPIMRGSEGYLAWVEGEVD
jgi:periplasmic divalent cation tolerance protein